MKTLNDHVIVYDDECPMCQAYTSAFVSTGMLDANGRKAYSEIKRSEMREVDWQRAKTEIALVDLKNKTVTYGVASLLAIFGNSLPFFKPLFATTLFQYIINRVYMFISYNRKVIIPGKAFQSPGACTPKMNYAYRWAYVIFTWLITSFILVNYSRLAVPLTPASDFYREFFMCGGQIVFQGAIVWIINKEKAIHYIGQMMTVSLAGAMALVPVFGFTGMISSRYFYAGYFMLVVMMMFLEHVKRVKKLQLPWLVSGSWVAYRCFVLYLILS